MTGSGVGMIVFGLLIVSCGLSALLGLAYNPSSSGLPFALLGFFLPGYSLPFLLYYACRATSKLAELEEKDLEPPRRR